MAQSSATLARHPNTPIPDVLAFTWSPPRAAPGMTSRGSGRNLQPAAGKLPSAIQQSVPTDVAVDLRAQQREAARLDPGQR